MSVDQNETLSAETAAALLTAIKAATPSAAGRGSDTLKSLADAYAAVVGAMPQPAPAPPPSPRPLGG